MDSNAQNNSVTNNTSVSSSDTVFSMPPVAPAPQTSNDTVNTPPTTSFSDFSINPSPTKKYATGKIVATILGLLVLVGGIGGGVYLTQQDQNLSEKAYSNQDCRLGIRQNGRGYYRSGQQEFVGDCEEFLNPPKDTCPPGQSLTLTTTNTTRCVTPTKCLSGGNGYKPGTVGTQSCGGQATGKKTCTAEKKVYKCMPPSAECDNVMVYSSDWVLLSDDEDLTKLKPNEVINLCVKGVEVGDGRFNKARFTINGDTLPDTTTKRPGSNDFCQSYTIKATDTKVEASAQIHHTNLGWK